MVSNTVIIFYFHPREIIQFDVRIFFRWVETQTFLEMLRIVDRGKKGEKGLKGYKLAHRHGKKGEKGYKL